MSNLSMLVLAVGIATLPACGDDPEVRIDAGPVDDGPVDGGPVDGGLIDAGPDAGPDDPLAGLTCEPIAACGGELVGRWTFTTVCFDPSELLVASYVYEDCPGQGVELDRRITGFLDVHDGGTYDIQAETEFEFTVTTPAACVPSYVESCAALAEPSPDADVTCTGEITQSCTCAGVERELNDESGTWVVAGSEVTFDDSGDPLGFCQEGDTLVLQFAPDPGDAPMSVFTLVR